MTGSVDWLSTLLFVAVLGGLPHLAVRLRLPRPVRLTVTVASAVMIAITFWNLVTMALRSR